MTDQEGLQEAGFSQAALLQRLRRVSRQVSVRSNCGAKVARRIRLLAQRIGRQDEAAGTCQE